MIVIATDAPLSNRNLRRMGKRAELAFGKVGAFSSNGSGDYVIIFSTHKTITEDKLSFTRRELKNSNMNALFLATVEATEEAIINSLFAAESIF